MNIVISNEGLSRANKALSHIRGGFPRAVAAAVNRTLESMKTDITAETKKRYFAKPSDIRKTLTPKRANGTKMQGILISRGGHRKLQDYKLTPKTPQKGRQTVFKGAVKRDGGLKPMPEAFMMDTPNAGFVLFIRIGSGRAWRNIKHVSSPAIPQIIKNQETVNAVQTHAEQVFEERLTHETRRLLNLLP